MHAGIAKHLIRLSVVSNFRFAKPHSTTPHYQLKVSRGLVIRLYYFNHSILTSQNGSNGVHFTPSILWYRHGMLTFVMMTQNYTVCYISYTPPNIDLVIYYQGMLVHTIRILND